MSTTRDLAVKEYELVCANIEDRAGRIFTIKSWSIATAAAGLGASVQLQSQSLLFLVSTACLAFWALEAGLQGSQRTLSLRARALEVFLNDANADPAFKAPWTSHFRSDAPTPLFALQRAFLPKVIVPAGFIGLFGMIVLIKDGFFWK